MGLLSQVLVVASWLAATIFALEQISPTEFVTSDGTHITFPNPKYFSTFLSSASLISKCSCENHDADFSAEEAK